MLYTSLRNNQKNNIDVASWYEECISAVANLFDNNGYSEDNKYLESNLEWTDFDKLEKDFSKKEIDKKVLAKIKEMSKISYKSPIIQHKIFFIEIDMLWDVVGMTENGLLKKSDLIEIKRKASKKGYNMSNGFSYEYKEYGKRYIDENGYENYEITKRYRGINDLIDTFFPCQEELAIDEDGDEYYKCTHCGNCE